MKNSFKLFLVIPILAILFLAMAQESYNKPIPEQTEISTAYSITVFTNPPCYNGTCTAKRLSDNTVFPCGVSGACYLTSAQQLTFDTYLVTVCCNGQYGTSTVVISAADPSPTITVSLTKTCVDNES